MCARFPIFFTKMEYFSTTFFQFVTFRFIAPTLQHEIFKFRPINLRRRIFLIRFHFSYAAPDCFSGVLDRLS
jgi:hypothetical protein